MSPERNAEGFYESSDGVDLLRIASFQKRMLVVVSAAVVLLSVYLIFSGAETGKAETGDCRRRFSDSFWGSKGAGRNYRWDRQLRENRF